MDDWLLYMDETVRPAHRRYLMYDLTGGRRGVTYAAFGPASIEGIARVVAKVFELADARVGFTAMQNKMQHSLEGSQKEAATQELEIGPPIATINIPAGHFAEGEFIAGIEINPKTGEAKILDRDPSAKD